MHTKGDVIRKAILFEISTFMNASNEDKKRLTTPVFNDVINFYNSVRDQLKHEILIKYESPFDHSTQQEVKGVCTSDHMKQWLVENNIAYFYNDLVATGIGIINQYHSFWFTSEEDATAFKLKWDN